MANPRPIGQRGFEPDGAGGRYEGGSFHLLPRGRLVCRHLADRGAGHRFAKEEHFMRRSLVVAPIVAFFALGLASPALADNPPGPPGPPSQSCQALEPNTPGNSAASPGSPFNEPGINSANGGIGGQNYSEKSQYDVACFQLSQH